MTPVELKYSILKLAFTGRIVQQKEQEIIVDKKAFCVDEAPFDVPENWKWNYIGNICEMYTGDSIAENVKKAKYEGLQDGFDYIGTKDVSFNHKITYDNGVKIPFKNDFKRAYPDCILMCIEGGSAGRKIAILDREVCFGNKLCMFKATSAFNKYIYYYLQSSEFKSIFKDNLSGIIGGVSIKKIKNILIPVPPIEEQKRIVSKIEELLPLVDRYEEAWNSLEKLNKNFPTDMMNSIVNFAMKGKLTKQNHIEENAESVLRAIKEKSLNGANAKEKDRIKHLFDEDIDPEIIPFELPANWKWCRWGCLVNVVSARRVHQSDWRNDGVPFYRAREIGKLADYGYVDNELFITEELFKQFSKNGVPKPGDLMVTAVGTLGKTYVVKENDKFYYKDASVICLENRNGLDPYYLKLVMESPFMSSQIKLNSSGTTVATLTIERMNEYLIPLPPLKEQKRIVAKLEELLPLCRKLVK